MTGLGRVLGVLLGLLALALAPATAMAFNDLHNIPGRTPIIIPKCCPATHVINKDDRCQLANETGVRVWRPRFTTEPGKETQMQPFYQLAIGPPVCEQHDSWSIYAYAGSSDRLELLASGKLRHYVRDQDALESDSKYSKSRYLHTYELQAHPEEPRFYDYKSGEYCIDKAILQDMQESTFAKVCRPKSITDWTNTDFIVSRIVDPLSHVICIICYLTTAVVYFVLPQLRDLVGNIITTISICFIVAQTADLVRIYTEFSSHVSFLVADIVLYTSIMAAFFWINSMGYYVHRHFKSSNVFLRSTDGRKYCYYSCYVWGCTATLGIIAVLAHFMFENPKKGPSETHICSANQRNVEWMGLAVFFIPIALLVITNIYFWRSTALTMGRILSFGRIHSKLRYSFHMFVKIFVVMTIAWIFFMLTWIPSNILCYINISTNILQGLFFLYMCVLSQKRVIFHLRKVCCYDNCLCKCCRPEEPTPESCEWGEEMHYIDTLDNFH